MELHVLFEDMPLEPRHQEFQQVLADRPSGIAGVQSAFQLAQALAQQAVLEALLQQPVMVEVLLFHQGFLAHEMVVRVFDHAHEKAAQLLGDGTTLKHLVKRVDHRKQTAMVLVDHRIANLV